MPESPPADEAFARRTFRMTSAVVNEIGIMSGGVSGGGKWTAVGKVRGWGSVAVFGVTSSLVEWGRSDGYGRCRSTNLRV